MSIEQISIGRFSQITRLTQKALRIYDERGLLVPAKDPITKYRFYSAGQIERGIKIKSLIELGFSLYEIDKLLKAADSKNHELIKDLISKRSIVIKQEIKRLQLIEEFLLERATLEDLFLSTTEPSIKKIPKIRVLSKRTQGPFFGLIGKLIGEVFQKIYGENNCGAQVIIAGPPMYICHDEGFMPDNADVEVAVPITGRINVEEDFEVRYLPETKVISTIHKGSYSNLGEAYTRVFEHARKNGLEINGPMREIYLTNPQEKPEDELLTEVQFPFD
jgi:effector-binding domain-containing protein